jgi:DNA-binding beta-propeller fold protein YncE
MKSAVLLFGVALALPIVTTPQPRAAALMHQVQETTLAGVRSAPGYFTLDKQHKHVMFSVPGDGAVHITDAFDGSPVHQIDHLPQPKDIFYLSDGDKLYVANGDGRVSVYDGVSFARQTSIDFVETVDRLRYDATAKRLYVTYGTVAIDAIDVATDKPLNLNLKLKSRIGGFQVEPKGSRIFANAPADKNIVVLNRSTGTVTMWPQPPGASENSPLVLDEARRRLFIGTATPPRLIVLNIDSGAIVASLSCPGGADDLFYDGERRRVYAIGSEGFLNIFQQADADHYTTTGRVPTAAGTRTGVWYPNRDQLYVAVPPIGGKGAPAGIRGALTIETTLIRGAR